MRKTLAVALGTGIALSFLPATSASAYCNTALYVVLGRCANECTLAAGAYRTADQTAGDKLPDVQFICAA